MTVIIVLKKQLDGFKMTIIVVLKIYTNNHYNN